MTTKELKVENFFKYALTSDITDATGDISFTMSTVPANKPGFLIISPDNAAKREVVFYHDIVGNTIYVKGINRSNPGTHSIGEYVQINDIAELFNFYAQVVSTTFYVEKTGNLSVKVWGGPVLVNGVSIDLADTALSLTDNTTNKIYFDYDDNTVKTTTSSIGGNLLLSNVVTASGVIASITPNITRPVTGLNGDAGTITVGTVTTLDPDESATVTNSGTTNDAVFNFGIPRGEKGNNGDIGQPGPAGQTISDNLTTPTGVVVTTDDSTYIRVTETSGFYTEYNLTGIRTYDVSNNLLTEKLDTGTFGAASITYTSGTEVNKVTGTVSFTGQPAYRDQENTFTQSQTFNSNVVFKGRVSFPWYSMGTQTGSFTMDANNAMAQKVVLNGPGATAHVLTFNNLVQGVYTIFVVQNGTGTLQFAIGTGCGNVTGVAIINSSFTQPHAITVGTHIYTILVAETKAHISYTGQSV